MRRRNLALAALPLLLLAGCRESAPTQTETDAAAAVPAAVHGGVRVRTARVHAGRLEVHNQVSGIVRAFHKATITAEASGQVQERAVERGQGVEVGQLLFRLDDSRLALALAQAAASARARQTDLAHARRELARGRKLVVENAISDQRLDDLEYRVASTGDQLALARVARDTAERLLADARISAPFSGVVEDVLVDAGDSVAAGTPVATLVELSRVRLRAGVTAAEAARLSVGSTARSHFPALGGTSRDAQLMSVGLVADPRSGTYDVEFWVDNPEGRLREGMLAAIELPDEDRPERLLIPRAALIQRRGHMAVFVVDGSPASAQARAVRVGRSGANRAEVLDGLREGERVVIDGHFALADGAPVVVEAGDPSAPER